MQTCVEKEKLDQSEDMAMVPALPIPGGAIARMQTLLETLPKQEKKAAEFLLDNLQSFSSQSIQGVAARAGVSDATYIRLAKRMGYSGFAEFKRNLIVDLASFSDPMQEVDRDDKPEIILKKVFESDVKWLYDSLKVIDAGAVERVAHMLLEYDKVVAWAVGMSTPFVYYLQQRLLRLGRMCALLTDPYEMEVQSGMVDADTLVIVTSRTGWPSSLFDACSKAKAHGAKVCVLSGQKDSKLAKIADYTLLTSTRSFKPSVVTSGVATFAVIDALFVMASLIQQDDSDESDEE